MELMTELAETHARIAATAIGEQPLTLSLSPRERGRWYQGRRAYCPFSHGDKDRMRGCSVHSTNKNTIGA